MKSNISRGASTFMRKRADKHVVWTRRTLLAAAAIAPALRKTEAITQQESKSESKAQVSLQKQRSA